MIRGGKHTAAITQSHLAEVIEKNWEDLPTFLCEETSEFKTSNATVLWRKPNSRACAELHLRFCFVKYISNIV